MFLKIMFSKNYLCSVSFTACNKNKIIRIYVSDNYTEDCRPTFFLASRCLKKDVTYRALFQSMQCEIKTNCIQSISNTFYNVIFSVACPVEC